MTKASKKSKWRLGLTLLTVALALAGCSGGNNGEGGGAPNANDEGSGGSAVKPVNLKIMWWGPDARHQATLKALDLYSKQTTNVTFTPEYLAWDAFWTKLATLAASKSMTDVLQMDGAYIQDYAKRGLLEDLSDIDLSGIVDSKLIEKLKIDGKLYGIPLSHNGTGLAYNKADLEAAGITLPAKDWTWDDYFAFAKEARAKLPEGKYGIADNSAGWDWFQFYQTSQGKDPIMVDGVKFNLDKDLWFQFQQTYEQFRKDKIVPPAQVQSAFKENDPKADPMASGTVMTRTATVGSVSVLEGMLPGKVGVVNNPTGPSGGGWAQATIFLSVSSSSKNKEEAKQFVRWFISDKEAGQALGMTRGIPINEEIYKELEPTMTKMDTIGKDLLNTALDKALPFYPAPPGWEDFVKTYQTEMESVMFGKQSLEKAYENIVEKGQETEEKLSKK
ncbi:multiple sugar transport system substrate-binding protein [Paenibacillus phyllosphaerae]|uniref:Multiple sugar transport system substrate-binding protein n=1 Tax=Paenibacillus phyllosphaerae TaxID=274593 RepID=A0A7W5B243_9BACL|nr:sugar ABC transporter substrate-binding protein [Paenibacillus phyllosphaerae]MBB3113044.1 multiple sugar transport system substrate-binding protein [Paenibacillus phyllosphaerae]